MSHAGTSPLEQIGNRYLVERELGRGGMATVYLAYDRELDEQIAVKVLLPDLAAALGAERFRREIGIESKLAHPHILAIHNSGEYNGLLYYTMPFVAGESLRARMDREGQLAVNEAVRIALAVAEALDYAHGQGVVHRDIKPENILLDGDRVLLADFGIARALNEQEGHRLTQTGITLGTPIYMSPEQSFAERDLDGRSDLYSLGCVLYEMLAGTPPYTGPNAQAITARHHMEPVPSITVVRPSVADEVEDLIFKVMAKSRVDRGTMREFATRLCTLLEAGRTTEMRTMATRRDSASTKASLLKRERRRLLVTAAVALLAMVAAAGTWWLNREPAFADALSSRVAVLYFQDASPGGQLGYLADGLTESLIDAMSRAGVDVVSRGGVSQFRGTSAPRDSVALVLAAAGDSVGFVIEGRVEPAGEGEARVSVTLADVANTNVTTETFAVPTIGDAATSGEQFAAINEFLRRRIGDRIALRRLEDAASTDEAWTLVQRAEFERKLGESSWRRGDTTGTSAAFARADSLAAAAAQSAPQWPAPLTLRGRLAHRQAQMMRRPPDAAPLLASADGFARQALALDGRDAGALELRGTVAYAHVLRGLVDDTAAARAVTDTAAKALEAAVNVDPQRASAWVRLSEVAYGQYNRALARDAARRAYEVDAYLENAGNVLWRLFITAYDMAEPTEASRWCEVGHSRFPESPLFLRCQLLLMTMRGASPDVDRGWELIEELNAVTPRPQRPFAGRFNRMLMSVALGRAGLTDSARAVMTGARADRTIDPQGELQGLEAFARTAIGDKEEAVRLLEGYLRDFPAHREGFRRLNTWWWQDIQTDPRFRALLTGT